MDSSLLHNQNNDNAIFPDVEHDYHGHPNYGRILLTLTGTVIIKFGGGLRFFSHRGYSYNFRNSYLEVSIGNAQFYAP